MATYLRRVNAIERQLVPPLRVVSAEGAAVVPAQPVRRVTGTLPFLAPKAATPSLHARERQLERAEGKITGLGSRLAALQAPVQVGRLRNLLLRLVGLQADLTRQTAELLAFIPGFQHALRPLAPASLRLERVLAVGQAYGAAAVQAVYTQKATALERFRGVATRVLRSLRALPVPRVSRPAFTAQVRSLAGMNRSAQKLALALRRQRTTGISPLLAGFDRAAALPASLSTQRAQQSAVEAYRRELSRVGELAQIAERERLHLQSTLT